MIYDYDIYIMFMYVLFMFNEVDYVLGFGVCWLRNILFCKLDDFLNFCYF